MTTRKTIRVDPTVVASLFNSLTVASLMNREALERRDLATCRVWTKAICTARDDLKALGINPIGFDHYAPFPLTLLEEAGNV